MGSRTVGGELEFELGVESGGAGRKEQSVQTSSTLESLKPKGEFAVKEGAIKEKAERIL